MTHNFVKTAALLSLAACALPANAKPSTEQVQVRIDYADLNVHTAAGADALRARIDKGIRETCTTSGYRNLADMRRESECRHSMAANAEVKLADVIGSSGKVRVAGR